MRHRLRTLAFGLLLAPAAAAAQKPDPFANCPTLPGSLQSPFAWLVVNESACVNLTDFISPRIPGKTWSLVADLNLQLARVQVSASFNADPFITFGATTTNFVPGPVTYAFLFGTPIVPGFYTNATSTGGVSVTNGAGGTAIVSPSAVYPTYISGYGTNGLVPTNLGVDLGVAPCQAGPGLPATVTQTCNYGSTANSFAPTFYDNLEALLTYTQTDAQSVASWSGAVTLTATAVPEPATFGLVLVGGFGVAGAAWSRRRARGSAG